MLNLIDYLRDATIVGVFAIIGFLHVLNRVSCALRKEIQESMREFRRWRNLF